MQLGGHDCCFYTTRPHTVDAVVRQRISAHSKTPTGASVETPLAPASPPRPRRAVAPPSATARNGAEVKAPFSAAAPPPLQGSEFGLRAGLACSSPAAPRTLLSGAHRDGRERKLAELLARRRIRFSSSLGRRGGVGECTRVVGRLDWPAAAFAPSSKATDRLRRRRRRADSCANDRSNYLQLP